MAATKEAIAIVLDIGPGMNQAPDGENTDLDTSLTAIQMILQRKVFAESKDEVALILCGTNDTANELAEGRSYEHITVARPLGPAEWTLLSYVQNDIQASSTSADFVDSLVVAMDHLVRGVEGKRGFGTKRLILFSNLSGAFGDDQLDDIIGGLKEAGIELNVIGPNLDEDEDEDDDDVPSAANHRKEHTPQQRAGEALLKHILNNVEGESYSFSEALPALSFFQSRQVRSVAWKCLMEISANLKIPISLYNRVKEAKPKTFKTVYAKEPDASLERLRTYHLNDEEETEIERSDVLDGHRYGSTLVPFSADDKEAMKFKTEKCFKVLGFTKNENVSLHQKLGDATWVCLAEKGDEAASVAISALCNALYETNNVAIVRRVYGNNSAVKLGMLVPHIKANYECLIYNELPFSEDIRTFTFGSLPVKEENSAANKKYSPSNEQLELMDQLITNMDLTKAEKDEDGEPKESLKPKLTFNPYIQQLYQCLQHRALHPDQPLPELSPVVAQSLNPPACLSDQCSDTFGAIKDKFKLEPVKEKAVETAEKVFNDEGSGEPSAKKAKLEDVDLNGGISDLMKVRVTEVGTVSPVEDFCALLKDSSQLDSVCGMMEQRIKQLVLHSFGTELYTKAMACLQCYRHELIKLSMAKQFNDFLHKFKISLKEINKQTFWQTIVEAKLGLVRKTECEEGGVSMEEAERFLEAREEQQVTEEPTQDEQDLLDEMA